MGGGRLRAQIFFRRGGKFCGATLAAEIKSFAVMDRLRGRPVGVNRHSADWIFFRRLYVFLHFAGHVEELDSGLRYKTLERVESQFLKLATT